MKYKILFIDWHGTLSHSLFWEQWLDPNHEYHIHHKALTKALFGGQQKIFDRWMLGEVDTADVLEYLSRETGVPQEVLKKDLIESCADMKLTFQELPKYIHKLKLRGTKCVIATDNAVIFRSWIYDRCNLDEIFDDVLISAELGVKKFGQCNGGKIPFFDQYLEKVGLSYDEVALIDDNIDDGYYARLGFDIYQVREDRQLKMILDDLLVQ